MRADEPFALYRQHSANVSLDYVVTLRESLALLHRNESPATAHLAQIGLQRVRRVIGTQAFDGFRRSRHPGHLLRALRWNPRYTTRALVLKLNPGAARRG